MTALEHLDHVGIVVDDLAEAQALFAAVGFREIRWIGRPDLQAVFVSAETSCWS